MDGGAWWATAHGITKGRTWLSTFTRLVGWEVTFEPDPDKGKRGSGGGAGMSCGLVPAELKLTWGSKSGGILVGAERGKRRVAGL